MLLLSLFATPFLLRYLAADTGFARGVFAGQAQRAFIDWLYPPRQTVFRPGCYRMVNGQLRRVGVLRSTSWSARRIARERARAVEDIWAGRGLPGGWRKEWGLPPIAGGTVNTFKTSGKWETGSNWSGSAVPKSTEDAVIEKNLRCEIIGAENACRSLLVETGVELAYFSEAAELKVGSTAVPKMPGFEGWILRIEAGVTVTGGGTLMLQSSSATEQKFAITPTIEAQVKMASSAKAKYLLETNLTTANVKASVVLSESAIFNSNGKTIEGSGITSVGGKKITLTLGKSKIVSTGAFGGWGTEGTISASESEIIMTGAGKDFAGAGYSYGTVVIEAQGVTVEGANTIATLRNNTKAKTKTCTATVSTLAAKELVVHSGEANLAVGVEVTDAEGAIPAGTTIVKKISGTEPAGLWELSNEVTKTVATAETITIYQAGLLLKGGVAQTVTTYTTNATSTEPARLASTKAGEAGKLKSGGSQTVSYQRIKDNTAEGGGTWTDEYGSLAESEVNVANNTGWVFKGGSGVAIPVNAASASSSTSLALNAPTAIPVASAEATSAATLALSAPTQIPVAAASAVSAGSLELHAPTAIPLLAASAASTGVLALGAPTQIAVASAQAASSASLSLGAPTQVAVAPASASSAAQLALGAPTGLLLAPASAQSTASLSLSAPTQIPLQGASAVSSASLSLAAGASIIPAVASAASSAQLALRAPTLIAVMPASATTTGVLALNAPTRIVLQSASGASAAQLALNAATEIIVAPATAGSSASLTLSVISKGVELPLMPAFASSTTSLLLAAPVRLGLEPASATSSGVLTLSVVTELYPTTLTFASRSPYTLVSVSRAPTSLTGAGRSPTTLEAEAR